MMRLYTLDEASVILRVKPSTLRQYCKQGKIVYRIHETRCGWFRRRKIYFTDDELKEFVDRQFPIPPDD